MTTKPKKWKPPRAGEDARVDAIRDLDRQITAGEAHLDRLRRNRRDMRTRLRGDGWTWTKIAQVSKQCIGAIQKDVALGVKPSRLPRKRTAA